MSDEIDRSSMLKHALINAVQYKGKTKANAVIGKILGENPELKSRLKDVSLLVKEVVDEVNTMSLHEQKDKMMELGIEMEKKGGEDDYGLPELPNVGKDVVMRMAPYPSGPLHIGNARMVVLNDEYVKRYNGKLILVYDDTIGSEEKGLIEGGYRLIKDSLDWMGVTVHAEYYKSDRMEMFYDYARKMIEKDWAYVCLCTADKLRNDRKEKTECEHRKQKVETNLKLWEKMLKGDFNEGEATVRLKTDMQHPDPAFRDRVLLRVSNRNHIRVGDKYHVWPMLEFSWAIDDHELGMTHILRGKDLIIEDVMEKFIWDKFGWEHPEFLHYGILKLEEAKLSKSKARAAIENGSLTGWDDPRTWSLQSLKKRGIQPDAIRIFIIRMGMSLSDISVPAEILYAENRKLIDSDAKRYFGVFDPIKISIKSVKEGTIGDCAKAPSHPEYPNHGERTIPVDLDNVYIERKDYERLKGEKVGLMNFCTVKLGKEAEFISTDIYMDDPKIHWVSETNAKARVIMPDGGEKTILVEPGMKDAKEGDVIQLVRTGFCRIDKIGKDIVLYFAHK